MAGMNSWVGRSLVTAALIASASPSLAKKYDPGANDTEIKIGNTMPYSGPQSAYSVVGHVEAAYFKMLNDRGGINGRKVLFISYDSQAAANKTVEHVRKLIERDEVLFVAGPLGTSANLAIRKYLNDRKVPQLFVAAGGSKFGDPNNFPYTMGLQPTYRGEARIYARYILDNYPGQKIAVLHQQDDTGEDLMRGLKEELGSRASSLLVAEESYELTDPTVDSQLLKMKASGATVFLNLASPKAAVQAIRKAREIGWKPAQFLYSNGNSVASVMKPAGVSDDEGIMSSGWSMDPSVPKWQATPEMKEWSAFLDKYVPGADKTDYNYVYGYITAQFVEHVLRRAGDDLTRENVMKQAASMKGFTPKLLLPGLQANTSSDDYFPIKQLQMMKFKGGQWEPFGPSIRLEGAR